MQQRKDWNSIKHKKDYFDKKRKTEQVLLEVYRQAVMRLYRLSQMGNARTT